MILETLLTGRTIAFNVKLLKVAGSVNAALLLSQLCFWSDKSEVKNYFYKTISEIEDEVGLSRHEQDTALKFLIARNLVSITLAGVPAKRYFSINWNALEKSLRDTENKASVQIAEKRQTSLQQKRVQKGREALEKASNKFAENRQTRFPKCGKHLRDDFRDDSKENLEKEKEGEKNFSKKEIEDYIVFACSHEKVRNPLLYEQKLRQKIEANDKTTFAAIGAFVANQHKNQVQTEISKLNDESFGKTFELVGKLHVFRRFGYAKDDPLYSKVHPGNETICFVEGWIDGKSDLLRVYSLDNFDAVKKFSREYLK